MSIELLDTIKAQAIETSHAKRESSRRRPSSLRIIYASNLKLLGDLWNHEQQRVVHWPSTRRNGFDHRDRLVRLRQLDPHDQRAKLVDDNARVVDHLTNAADT